MGVTIQYTRNCMELQTGRPVTRANWPQSVTGVKDEGHATLIEVTNVRQSTHTVWWHCSPENRHFKDAQQLIIARTTLNFIHKNVQYRYYATMRLPGTLLTTFSPCCALREHGIIVSALHCLDMTYVTGQYKYSASCSGRSHTTQIDTKHQDHQKSSV